MSEIERRMRSKPTEFGFMRNLPELSMGQMMLSYSIMAVVTLGLIGGVAYISVI